MKKNTTKTKTKKLSQELAVVKDELAFLQDKSRLSLVQASPLSKEQILTIFQKTPAKHVYTRPAKGGGTWDYVTGVYVKKVLNYVFGFMWDFEVVEHGVQQKQVWVKGRLTVKDPKTGLTITKMQFGRADIKFKKDAPDTMLDFGNDLKAASTDALKKCASEFGIASDIYGKNEFKEVAQKETEKEVVPVSPTMQKSTICQQCFEEGKETAITQQVDAYSRRFFGKPLCADHQKLMKKHETK